MDRELEKLWCQYTKYVVENVPNYDDTDFTFAKFMKWLMSKNVI